MYNMFYMEVYMDSFPYQERSLYGALIADLLVYVPYLMHDARAHSLGRIVATMFLLMAVQIVLQIAVAIATRNRLQDERDLLIRLRGYRAGYIAFASFIFLGLAALWLHAAAGQINPSRMALHFLSVMFGMLVTADVVRVVTQLIDYRRSV